MNGIDMADTIAAKDVTMAYLLQILVENKGSDLHIQAGDPPRGRIRGELVAFPVEPLPPEEVVRLAKEDQPGRRIVESAELRAWAQGPPGANRVPVS